MSVIRTPTKSIAMPVGDEPLLAHEPEKAGEWLADFVRRHPRLLILTGAGVSTGSGIPDYRDGEGSWKRKQPVQHGEFMSSLYARQRYWGRSLIGWPVIRNATPNLAHQQIAELEALGHSTLLVTQNVDRLHQKAGSLLTMDLHGRADEVICMACGDRSTRDEVHGRCAELNPGFGDFSATVAPDGDADLELDFTRFEIVDCDHCGGVLKPDVVFFGDYVPKQRVQTALDALKASDGLLVLGSSLMVYSGLRFCRYAKEWSKPMATLNLGRTRADSLVDLKLNAPISDTLACAIQQL